MIRRDLATHPVAHLSGAHLAAAQGASPEDPFVQRDLAEGQAALDEFLAADIVVVGAPMYNFTVPSQLKAWIDRLAVAGRTFRYTAEGPEGLAGGKKVVVVSTRGGFYGPETANAALEHQESYLRGIFGFFGITDLSSCAPRGWPSASNSGPRPFRPPRRRSAVSRPEHTPLATSGDTR